MHFIGIDPGQTGAIAIVTEDRIKVTNFKEVEYSSLLEILINSRGTVQACIEKQWGRPVSGAASSFCLGCNYCEWKLVLELAKVSYIEVPPMTWQKKILNTSLKKSADTKPLAIEYVRKAHPELEIPVMKKKADVAKYSGMCDAICIALYGRLVHLNVIEG